MLGGKAAGDDPFLKFKAEAKRLAKDYGYGEI